jgi:hypothetical protein
MHIKGKKTEKKIRKKNKHILLRGNFIIVNRELVYFITEGIINVIYTLNYIILY